MPAGGEAAHLVVHLGDQRAGRVDRAQLALRPPRACTDRRDAVRREDHGGPVGHLVDLLDEDRRPGPAATCTTCRLCTIWRRTYTGRPVVVEGLLDGLHRPIDAGAVPARGREQDPLGSHAVNGTDSRTGTGALPVGHSGDMADHPAVRRPGTAPGPASGRSGSRGLGRRRRRRTGRRLCPTRSLELPVLAVSTALQLSLRAQQHYAALTVRGDELLTPLRGGAPDEPPEWARFDDDRRRRPGRRPTPTTDRDRRRRPAADDTAPTPAQNGCAARRRGQEGADQEGTRQEGRRRNEGPGDEDAGHEARRPPRTPAENATAGQERAGPAHRQAVGVRPDRRQLEPDRTARELARGAGPGPGRRAEDRAVDRPARRDLGRGADRRAAPPPGRADPVPGAARHRRQHLAQRDLRARRAARRGRRGRRGWCCAPVRTSTSSGAR